MRFAFKFIRIEFNASLVERLEPGAWPGDWRLEPAPSSTRQWGDEWVRSARSAILAVPSVLLPQETNFLLNPAHADFRKITLSPPIDFAFDPRLLA